MYACISNIVIRSLQDNQNKKIVFLKDVSWENKKTKFHPFQSGLIVKKNKSEIIVATTDGSIKIKKVLNQKKIDIKKIIKVGHLLYSLNSDLETSMIYLPIYNS